MTRQPLKLGITGSIGMGKTTIAKEIGKFDYPIWDADSVVHKLYERGKEGYDIISKLAPEAVQVKSINREILTNLILKKPTLLRQINHSINPFINLHREKFIDKNKNKKLLVFDIPLLFENSCELWLDKVIVATAPKLVQKKRVLARKAMTENKFYHILACQIDNEEKIKKADYIIDTNTKRSILSKRIVNILQEILDQHD